jgi:phosphoribosylformylglycinamidine cyclo-ligase
MLPEGTQAAIRRGSWQRPGLFDWLQQKGNVAEDEMHRVFNCGIGMVLAVAPEDVEPAVAILRNAGETVYRIGAVEAGPAGEPQALIG